MVVTCSFSLEDNNSTTMLLELEVGISQLALLANLSCSYE